MVQFWQADGVTNPEPDSSSPATLDTTTPLPDPNLGDAVATPLVAYLRTPARGHRWWAAPLAALGLLLALAPIVVSFVPSRAVIDKTRCVEWDTSEQPAQCVEQTTEPVEYALVPASAEPVGSRLRITGATTYESSGQIYFVTITEPVISLLDWWIVEDHPGTRLRSYNEKYPNNQTPQDAVEVGQRQMRTAKQDAMFVALQVAGYPVELEPGEVIVGNLLCLKANAAGTECVEYSPADELLDPNDVITAVNGTPVEIVDDLVAILREIEPGEKATVDFTRDGEEMSGEIETIAAPDEDPIRTIIGFRPVDTTTVKLPDGITIDIDTDSIGGPSAGLAFTLTLIDALTEGDLMGGHKVAVTGTIDLEGNVGAIGGLNSKASAVMQMGVKYFLVPVSQGEDGLDGIAQARKVVGDEVEIIPVANLAEALAALARIGGDPVEPPTTTTTT